MSYNGRMSAKRPFLKNIKIKNLRKVAIFHLEFIVICQFEWQGKGRRGVKLSFMLFLSIRGVHMPAMPALQVHYEKEKVAENI